MEQPGNSVPAEAARLSYNNNFLRQLLASLRLVAGASYPVILAESRLEQYQDQLPPANTEMAASHAAIARLFGAAYRHLQPAQFLLVLMNMGERQAQATWEYPEIQAVAQELESVPPADRISVAWRRFNIILQQQGRGDNRQVHSDDQADHLIVEGCPYCLNIHDADGPVCHSLVRYYEVMLRKLTGRAVVIRETECAATGHGRCVFTVRRERAIPHSRAGEI